MMALNRSRLRHAALLLAALASLPARAGSFAEEFSLARQHGRVRHQLTIDNDSLLFKRDDGLYTSGIEYALQYRLERPDGQLTYGWHVGQALYTASDIKLPPAEVGPPDHPYAGWLFAGIYREQAARDGSRWRFGIDVGCLGPCAGGRAVQTNLHRLLRQPLPMGWSRQVGNEAGIVLAADYAPLRWQLAPGVGLAPNFHGRFGNIFTDAGIGLRLDGPMPDERTGTARLHGFVRADVSGVAYNATLQGGYFSHDDPHTVRPKRVVGELEAGLAWRAGDVALQASLVRRTNEVAGLPNGIGMQNFLRLVLLYVPAGGPAH